MTIHLLAVGERTKTVAGIIALAAIVAVAAPTAARAANPSTTATLHEGIGMGDKPSKRVRTMQRALVRRGYGVGAPGIDGRFGPLTAGAVRRLQGDKGLVVDGIVGPRTRRALGLRTRPRARADSSPGRTRERRARTRPRRPQTSPPKRDVRPPSTTNQTNQTNQTRPVATAPPRRDVEGKQPTRWPLFLIAGVAAGALIAALWALVMAVPHRRERREAIIRPNDREAAADSGAAAVVANRSETAATGAPSAASRTEAVGPAAGHEPERQAAGGADEPAAPAAPVPVGEPGDEAPEAASADEPRTRRGSPRFRAGAAAEPDDATRHAAPSEPVARPIIGYVTVKRTVRGDQLHSQARAIDEACERAGWQLLEIVRDTEGGRTFERPGLHYALERIADGEADGLIVSDLKLLSHSVVELGALLAWFWDAGAALIALDLGVDTSTDEGHHAASALITMSEWEREWTVHAPGLHVAGRRASGREPDTSWIADRPELVERIAAMKHDRMTLRAIANQLNAERVPAVRGGTEWRASSVQAVLNYHRGRSWPREQLPSLENRGFR
jgi:DNA invertase Pin-like site-specific DNA recombinase/peptidoglycan hydrolase-like protein with peptidoglycan-binding domain